MCISQAYCVCIYNMLHVVFKGEEEEEGSEFELDGKVVDFVKQLGHRQNITEIEAMVTKLCTVNNENLG
jgi:hypothetical protein